MAVFCQGPGEVGLHKEKSTADKWQQERFPTIQATLHVLVSLISSPRGYNKAECTKSSRVSLGTQRQQGRNSKRDIVQCQLAGDVEQTFNRYGLSTKLFIFTFQTVSGEGHFRVYKGFSHVLSPLLVV